MTGAAVIGPTLPSLDDVGRAFPRWHCWAGVSGLLYAGRRHSSPPVVVRAQDPLELFREIRTAESRFDHRPLVSTAAQQR
jgi:hypothetical protein